MMLKRKCFITTTLLSYLVSICGAVPIYNVVTADSDSQETAEIPEELILDDDDSTSHNLERLVSAATCLVAGVEYTHGQQIYRADQCEFCLCLDGEMFCWWQECPPALDGPCKDRRPFTPCANGGDKLSPAQRGGAIVKDTQKVIEAATTSGKLDSGWSNETSFDGTVTDNIDTNSVGTQSNPDVTPVTSTTITTTVCVVMGTEYKIGEMLPHDTGNCVECICGQGARVKCFPHLCGRPGDDTLDLPDAV